MARVRRFVLTLLVVLLVLFAMLFTLNNQEPVSLDFLLYQTPPLSVALWLVLTLILGVILGAAAASVTVARSRMARRRTEKQLKRSEKTLKRQQRDAAKSIE